MDQQGQPRPGQKPLRRALQGEGWGQSAHQKIRLPLLGTVHTGAGHAPALFGIYGSGVRTWFQDRLVSSREFQFASQTHNCSGTVIQTLIAGGATAFAPSPRGLVSMSIFLVSRATAMMHQVNN